MGYDVAVKEQEKWLEGQNEKLRREREVRAMQTEDSSAHWMRVIAPLALAVLEAGPAEGGVSEQPEGGGLWIGGVGAGFLRGARRQSCLRGDEGGIG